MRFIPLVLTTELALDIDVVIYTTYVCIKDENGIIYGKVLKSVERRNIWEERRAVEKNNDEKNVPQYIKVKASSVNDNEYAAPGLYWSGAKMTLFGPKDCRLIYAGNDVSVFSDEIIKYIEMYIIMFGKYRDVPAEQRAEMVFLNVQYRDLYEYHLAGVRIGDEIFARGVYGTEGNDFRISISDTIDETDMCESLFDVPHYLAKIPMDSKLGEGPLYILEHANTDPYILTNLDAVYNIVLNVRREVWES